MPRRTSPRTACLLLLSLLTLAACHHGGGSGAKLYDQISHGIGIGVNFGASPDQAHAVLGQPGAAVATKDSPVAQDFYVAANPDGTLPPMPDADATQLTLTYYQGKLVSIFNRYHPETPDAKPPPFVAEPVSGVKLGNRRSQFALALGKPNYGKLKDSWRFTGKDGSTVTVTPQFTKVETLHDELCSGLSVEYAGSGAQPGQGEYFQKQKSKQEMIHHLGGK